MVADQRVREREREKGKGDFGGREGAFRDRRDRGRPVPIISNIPQSISTRVKLPPIVII